MPTAASPAVTRPRLALAIGGALAAVGLAIVGVGPSDFGAAVTLLGLVVFIGGIHSFGRLGPEGPA